LRTGSQRKRQHGLCYNDSGKNTKEKAIQK
jgi:hypothetical protein